MDLNKKQTQLDNEIDLYDVLIFIKSNFKVIMIFTILGFFLGLIYEKIMPQTFEGKALVIPLKTKENKNLLESSLTLSKMEFESFYNQKTIEECYVKSEKNHRTPEESSADIIYRTKRSINKFESFEIILEDQNKALLSSCLFHIGKNILENQLREAETIISLNKISQNRVENNIDFLKKNIKKIRSDIFISELLRELTNLNQINISSLDLKKDDESIFIRIYEKKQVIRKKQIGLFLGLCFGILTAYLRKK